MIIRTWTELCSAVDELGFLPLLECGLDGFSVEAMTPPENWAGRSEENPWEWRYYAANSGLVAYGKFFRRKAAFVSREWLPVLANFRRRGYDFDALYDDGLAPYRHERIMARFENGERLTSQQLKSEAADSKGLDTALTELMMQTYLVTAGFEQKKNRRGEGYGWPVSVYARAEDVFGAEHVRSCYGESPEQSLERLKDRCAMLVPWAGEKKIMTFLGGKPAHDPARPESEK